MHCIFLSFCGILSRLLRLIVKLWIEKCKTDNSVTAGEDAGAAQADFHGLLEPLGLVDVESTERRSHQSTHDHRCSHESRKLLKHKTLVLFPFLLSCQTLSYCSTVLIVLGFSAYSIALGGCIQIGDFGDFKFGALVGKYELWKCWDRIEYMQD